MLDWEHNSYRELIEEYAVNPIFEIKNNLSLGLICTSFILLDYIANCIYGSELEVSKDPSNILLDSDDENIRILIIL